MGVNSFPKTVTRQRRDCDLNPGLSAPESSALTTRLTSHPGHMYLNINRGQFCSWKATASRFGHFHPRKKTLFLLSRFKIGYPNPLQ